MSFRAILTRSIAMVALSAAIAPWAQAQVRGTPGATDSVIFPDSRQLPIPTPPFAGAIMPSVRDSTPAWPPQVAAPEGAPNVLLILTDDVGFGAPATFGGVVPTPALDRVAQAGLRYTQFHTTALCSPTRAALLTGRNHHSVGFGNISELSTAFPGYNSIIPPETANVAATLRQNGFSTAWFGKNHNVPPWEANPVGPFTNWPIGQGYDYFYGFVGGDTSQWQPGNLFRNTTAIHPYIGQPGWNLSTAMADDAIQHIRTQSSVAPSRPWFIHYAPGGTHAPHQPPPEWIARFAGQFDGGWEVLRQRIFANQQRLGVIPANAQLPAWPDFLPSWESLTPDARRLLTRQVEVYAAFLAYTDHEIGRVIQAVEDLGQINNTLIIYISGDNGGSAEGSMNGTMNEVAYFNGAAFTVEQMMPFLDAWGGDRTYNHMAVPWTFAFNTPYRWTKQIASHLGGIRNGMAISWPARITDRGGIRTQFHHVIDVVPTILEALGVPQPDQVNGIAQRPIEGVSMAYSWDRANIAAPSRRRTQYFEILGNRGIYHDGWMASTTPPSPPWDSTSPRPADVVNGYQWELYNLTEDPTQVNNLAAAQPARLRSMQDMFLMEATRYQVLPLDNSLLTRMIAPRPGPAAGRRQFVYSGPVSAIQASAAPNILNRSYRITAQVEVPAGGANGMVVTQGGRFSGWGLYLREGRPVFTMNLLGLHRPQWVSPTALPPGTHSIVFDWTMAPQGGPFGRGGSGTLSVNGQQVAQQALPQTLPFTWAWDETFDVGSDTGTSVHDTDYQSPFPFTGRIQRVTVDLGESTITPESLRAAAEAAARAAEAARAQPAAAPARRN
ncbi:arylsulfatase [Sediminicoccus sp. KRV36]|uniref:arylsulfatase n=1 Tax=Sediminicoccus sp. KRV36 TaxID=3133721 RepID=UPI00200F06E6|nr:arylsulfatase [Sediminicoccus rosea]UPY38446.1 arylsulfatase [Sediminicoccus rosea]